MRIVVKARVCLMSRSIAASRVGAKEELGLAAAGFDDPP